MVQNPSIIRRTCAMKFLLENRVTPQTLPLWQDQLRSIFTDSNEYDLFVDEFITDKVLTFFADDFIAPEQPIDAYPYVRFQQEHMHIHDFYNLKCPA